MVRENGLLIELKEYKIQRFSNYLKPSHNCGQLAATETF